MTKLISVLRAASGLIGELFDKAESQFSEKQQTAFRVDALSVVAATQALAASPCDGFTSDGYELPLAEIGQAKDAVSAIEPGDAASILAAHLETVQALEAMRAVTA